MANSGALSRIAPEEIFADEVVTTIERRREPTELRFEKFRSLYDTGPDRKWEVEVLKPLFQYVNMPQGWDSYSGVPLRRDTAFFALQILNETMRPRTPIPQVVPSPIGGVQLEWHEKEVDLELHITAPYQCELWFEDHRTGEQTSEELSNDIAPLVKAISELTSR